MRIVIFDYAGHAAPVELSRSLATRGHNVLHLYSMDVQSPKWDLVRRQQDPSTLTIRGLATGLAPDEARLIPNWLYCKRRGHQFAQAAHAFAPDIVMATSSTLFLHSAFHAAFRKKPVQFVYWLRNFYFPSFDQALEQKPAVLDRLLGASFRSLEGRLLRESDVIIVPAEYIMSMLNEGWGIHDRRCMVVRQWAPLDRVSPGDKMNEWAAKHGVSAQRVVLHTGRLDFERCQLLLACAQRLHGRGDTLLVVVADDDSVAFLAREAQTRGLRNLKVLPFQPYENYQQVLASADVLLCLVREQDGVLSVPGTLAFYLCAGRAIVLSAPCENLANDIIRESGAGIAVDPGDAQAICRATARLLDDTVVRERAAAAGRAYAQRDFDIVTITDRFERLFERVLAGPARGKAAAASPTRIYAAQEQSEHGPLPRERDRL
jgi:colanic acid biosynthesis glycosyl transferase WcaI